MEKLYYTYESPEGECGFKLLFSIDNEDRDLELLEYKIHTRTNSVEIDKTKARLLKDPSFIKGWTSFMFSYAYKGSTGVIDVVFGSFFDENKMPVDFCKLFMGFTDYESAKLYYELI